MPEDAHVAPAARSPASPRTDELHALVADRGPRLAEVDLQLPARRRLEPQRRPRFRLQRLAQRRHRPLDRAQADAIRPCSRARSWRTTSALPPWRREALRQPILQPVQRLARARRPVAAQPPACDVTPHRVAAAAQLRRDPPRRPSPAPSAAASLPPRPASASNSLAAKTSQAAKSTQPKR